MNLSVKAFCESFQFMLLQPQEPPFFSIVSFADYEIANTRCPQQLPTGPILKSLCRQVPHMSTLAIAAALNHAVRQMPVEQVYLNIGIWKGFSFAAGLVGNENKRGIGVDNFGFWNSSQAEVEHVLDVFAVRQGQVVSGDFEDYLKHQHQGTIGVYFYDGPHDYESQLKALVLAEPFFVRGTVIFVDDINVEGPRRSIIAFLEMFPNGYETLFVCETAGNSHPTFWNGIHILRKK